MGWRNLTIGPISLVNNTPPAYPRKRNTGGSLSHFELGLSGKPGRPFIYAKPALTVDDQVDRLRDRGLALGDRAAAIKQIRAIGYYRFSAYCLPFEHKTTSGSPRTKLFLSGVHFDHIIDLYVFDRKLRLLVMEAIERIEVAVRSSWVNHMTLVNGAHAHLNPDLFRAPFKHAKMVAKLAADVEDSQEEFIVYYRKNHANPYMPPLWAVAELMTFRELSSWYAATKDHGVRAAVAIDIGMPTKEVLESILQVFTLIRNVCAHHGRLWNRLLVKRLPVIRRLKNEIILEFLGSSQQVEKSIYNSLVVMIHILRAQIGHDSFMTRLTAHMNTATAWQLTRMGFPRDWRDRPIWTTA